MTQTKPNDFFFGCLRPSIPNEFLSGSMVRCYNISRQFYLRKSYFFTIFQSNFFQSITKVTFSEKLFLQSSCLFWGAPFSRTITFSLHFFFKEKVLPRNHTLRIGNSLVQLPFGTATHRRATFWKQILLRSINFFKKIRKAIFRLTYLFLRATFLMPLS